MKTPLISIQLFFNQPIVFNNVSMVIDLNGPNNIQLRMQAYDEDENNWDAKYAAFQSTGGQDIE